MNNKKIYKDYAIKKILNRLNNENKVTSSNNIKVVCILDRFSYDCLKYEGDFHQLGTKNWKNIIDRVKPDMLFVESAWQGYNYEWINKIANMGIFKDRTLIDLTNYCKKNNIPTVFWAKEDPNDFYIFIEAAKLFEYVFTTDANCIPKHKDILGHDRVYLLPFAAQPKIHNPINRDKERLGKVAFAGSWYDKFDKRKIFMNNLLRPSKKYGLTIYNRFSNLNDSQFKYPDEYKPYIRKSLNYSDMVKEYKKYDVFLNVNSNDTSPTTFSRRVYELLACGTPVISSFNPGIINYFKGIVMISKSEEDTEKHLSMLLKDKDLRDRLSLLGQRKVFLNHTYKEFLNTVLNKLGINKYKKINEGVSIISFADNNLLDNTINNYLLQQYPEKELFLIINEEPINSKKLYNISKKHDDIKILKVPKDICIGRGINMAINLSKYNYISIFDSKSYYGPNYLIDLINTFKYTECYIAGKQTIYKYNNKTKSLMILNPNCEYRFTNSITQSTLTFKKEVLSKVKFRDTNYYHKSFIEDCVKNGFKIYSSDRFNHVFFENSNVTNNPKELIEKEFSSVII